LSRLAACSSNAGRSAERGIGTGAR
jgi:hypothetical protein